MKNNKKKLIYPLFNENLLNKIFIFFFIINKNSFTT